MMLTPAMKAEVRRARSAASISRQQGDEQAAWHALVRAHIISQPALKIHLAVHRDMLSLAVEQRDVREAAGQAVRLMLAPLGHVLGRTPWGNSGRSTMNKFARAALPEDIVALYAEAGIKVN